MTILPKFQELFEIAYVGNSDRLYEWLEEHVIKPNHDYWHEKMGEGDWHEYSQIMWFIDRIPKSDELKQGLYDFCHQNEHPNPSRTRKTCQDEVVEIARQFLDDDTSRMSALARISDALLSACAEVDRLNREISRLTAVKSEAGREALVIWAKQTKDVAGIYAAEQLAQRCLEAESQVTALASMLGQPSSDHLAAVERSKQFMDLASTLKTKLEKCRCGMDPECEWCQGEGRTDGKP